MKKTTICLIGLFTLFAYGNASESAEASAQPQLIGRKHSRNGPEIYEERAPKRPSPQLSIYDVARFFLMKDQETVKHGDHLKAPVNKTKLQKLCYYAQGYSMAFNGTPLFSEEMVAYQYGPYNEELNHQYQRLLQEAKNGPVDYAFYTLDDRLILEVVWSMKESHTGSDLVAATHREDPWREAEKQKGISLHNIISQSSMRNFFKKKDEAYQPKVHALKILPNLDLNPLNFSKKFYELTSYINSIVKKKECTPAQIEDIFTKMTTRDALTVWERRMQYFNHPGSSFYKWPHQKPEQAVAAALFFPQELVDPDENDAVLYGRPHIQELLAYSAKYEDPLALYHLSRVLESYSIGEEDLIAQRGDVLLEAAQKRVVDLEGDEEGLPYYFAGQLFILLGNKEKAERAFRKGDSHGDGRATYQLALLTESQEEKIAFYNRSHGLSYQKALLGLARAAGNLDDQFDYYWKAGEAGVAEGYYELGNMVGRRGYRYQGEEPAKQRNNPKEYFEKAGDLGLLSAYSKAAQEYLGAGHRQEALNLFIKQTIEGGLGLDDADRFTSLLKENGEDAVNLYQQYRGTLLSSFLEEHFPGLASEEKGSRSFDADYFNGLADIALKQGGDEDEAMEEAI
jgi:uncharacterized phage-associated protein